MSPILPESKSWASLDAIERAAALEEARRVGAEVARHNLAGLHRPDRDSILFTFDYRYGAQDGEHDPRAMAVYEAAVAEFSRLTAEHRAARAQQPMPLRHR